MFEWPLSSNNLMNYEWPGVNPIEQGSQTQIDSGAASAFKKGLECRIKKGEKITSEFTLKN